MIRLALGARCRRADDARPAVLGNGPVGRGQQAGIEQRGQRQGADPRARPAQEGPAMDRGLPRRRDDVGVHGSVPGDRLVEVEEHAGRRGPGRQLGADRRRAGGLASRPRSRALARRQGRSGTRLRCFSHEPEDEIAFLGPGRPSQHQAIGQEQARLGSGARFADQTARPARGPPRRRWDRSAAPAPGSVCSTGPAGPRIPRGWRRRTPAGWGAGRSAASRCKARGDTGSLPCRRRTSGSGS